MRIIAVVIMWSMGAWIQARPLQCLSLPTTHHTKHYSFSHCAKRKSPRHLPLLLSKNTFTWRQQFRNSLLLSRHIQLVKLRWYFSITSIPSCCFEHRFASFSSWLWGRLGWCVVASCVVTSVITHLGWNWSFAQESQKPFPSALVKYYGP